MKLVTHQSGPQDAPTIVFLHGLGVSSWMWIDQIESLQNHYHCIAVDLPGNGESYRHKWQSLADSAAQVADLIRQHAAGGRAHVVGLSLGGYVSLNLLANHPETVQSMVISGVTPVPLPRPTLMKALTNIMAPVMRWKVVARLSGKAMQLPADAIEMYQRDMARLTPAMIRSIYDEVIYFNLPPIEDQHTRRLLVTSGDSEARPILHGLNLFAEAFPEATVAQALNAHHGWNGEHPALFSDMVAAWINEQPLPSDLHILQRPIKNALFA